MAWNANLDIARRFTSRKTMKHRRESTAVLSVAGALVEYHKGRINSGIFDLNTHMDGGYAWSKYWEKSG